MPTIRTAVSKNAKLTPNEADSNMKRQSTAQGSNYNLTAAHNRDCHVLANGVAATLPTASASLTETGDWRITIKAEGASATVATGGQYVDGRTSTITLTQYECVTIVMNEAGTAFNVTDRWFDFATHQTVSANGFQKLPGGLILQWGSATTSATPGVDTTVTFPEPFPTQLLVVTIGTVYDTGVGGIASPPNVCIHGEYSASFLANNVSQTAGAITFRWIALGY